jgi:Glu-tRNA(Gln) amidotransferase subunit E-like FAD-binding protein
LTKEELIQQAKRIIQETQGNANGGLSQATEFLRIYAGEDSSFYKTLFEVQPRSSDAFKSVYVNQVLTSFSQFVQNGLLRSISLEREIQIDTVSDYLEQADSLLKDKNVHAAAVAVIIGASLEEFLRNWLEEERVDFSKIKNNLDSYSKELRKLNLISKQDLKDIISWGGTRNDAAHGHWENVADKNRIKLMLDGVNLFMRKYGSN